MNHLHSYPSVMQIGHKMIADIFTGDVLVEEKIDGSQFSFGLINGELVCRSKGKQQLIDAPDKMFERAIAVIRELPLHPEWVYRGEYLEKPKHNTLAYSRIPAKHIMLYDINTGLEEYMNPIAKQEEAARLGLECVPLIYSGQVTNFEAFKDFLDRESSLGGCKVEGVVIKNYGLFTAEKKVAMGKYVSEAFKETHQKDWGDRNPNKAEIEALLIEQYRTDARWQKAVQHLQEAGLLEGSPKDIAALMKEVPVDVLKECENEIKEALFKHFWPKISRGITRGLPEWYKKTLAQGAFEVSE
jgi:hypothetical protein